MKSLLSSLLLLFVTGIYAQHKPVVHNYSTLKPSDWEIPHTDTLFYTMGKYEGSNALIMNRKIRNYKAGTAIYPKNLNFKNGTIELDMAWPPDRGGYIGLAFRIKDENHYETVYFRPESSGTINAIQYMPKKKTEFNWWDYEADKYQAVATLPLHGWFHVRAVVKGSTVRIFVNNQPSAALTYTLLDGSLASGSVGYWFGNSAVAAYRNLRVTRN